MQNKVKPSYHRIKVFEYLMEKRNHPTVDEIYNELIKKLPTLSKTTVYNTLNLFRETNLARMIINDENEARYDIDMSDHGHFKCEVCGKIYDFAIDRDDIVTKGLNSFKIKAIDVYYKGICPGCLDNKK